MIPLAPRFGYTRALLRASTPTPAASRPGEVLVELETLLERWDGETVVVRRDSHSGAWIFIAIHSTRLGPAVGGTRMKTYPDVSAALQDALRLSAGMTYKFAVPGLSYGFKYISIFHDFVICKSHLGF